MAKKNRRNPPQVLDTIPGPVADGLRLTRARREENLLRLCTTYRIGLEGFNQAVAWFDWMVTLCSDDTLKRLLERVVLNVHRGVEAALAGDYPTVNDIGRDLMEIEVLLRDFARDPRQLQKWAEGPDPGFRSDAFGFGVILDRLRVAAGVPQTQLLPEKREYKAHSESLHPTPAGRPTVAWADDGDVEAQFEHDLGDLLMHVGRSVGATMALADGADHFPLPYGAESSPTPPLDAMDAVGDILGIRAGEFDEVLLREAGDQMEARGPFNKGDSFFRKQPPPE